MSVSVLILTLNEENNLPGCLASVSWSDDVVVLDSFSNDGTTAIAAQHGARVVQRKFDNYATHRNFGLHSVNYKNNWVLMLDADERVTPALSEEIKRIAAQPITETTMYRMRRKDFFFGQWLKRSSGYPTWFGRLVRPSMVRVEREINEEFITEGRIELLNSHLEHYPFNKGIAWWYERHNRYSTMEAQATITERQGSINWVDILCRDPVRRRRGLKKIAYRLPARPLIVFIYLYIVRLGFIDGIPGLYFSAMRASYELMIDLKVKELSVI